MEKLLDSKYGDGDVTELVESADIGILMALQIILQQLLEQFDRFEKADNDEEKKEEGKEEQKE